MIRAPIDSILPSFIPAILEKGVPGYESAPLIPNERRLSLTEIRSLFAATVLLGTLNQAMNKDLDYDRVLQALYHSLSELNDLTQDEKVFARQLIDRFYQFKIFRADHPFDDWLCEALWEQFQRIPYTYPSAMSDAISYALTVNQSLDRCILEY